MVSLDDKLPYCFGRLFINWNTDFRIKYMDVEKSFLSFAKMLGLLFCLMLLFNTSQGDSKQYNICSKEPETFSQIIFHLSSRLINEITVEENFFISPLSISAALGMIYIGAGGSTKSQMANALQYNITDNQCPDLKILDGFRDLTQSLEADDEILSVIIANAVFIQTGYPVSPNYIFKLKQYFKSDVRYENFLHEGQLTMNNINDWVSNKTRTQIKKLLNEPLDTMTLMVLANVIYFKGQWVHPFTDTWNSFFHTMNGTPKVISFMKMEENFNYYHDDSTKYSFLELPYSGGNVSMLLILPANTYDPPTFQLNNQVLCEIRKNFVSRRVMVGLPKINLAYSRELSNDMSKFGMTQLFSDRADLTGMREQNDLHVSLMLHKAVIEINEKGSQASAISGVGIDSRRRPTHEAIFWANHPFLFYIIDSRREIILFAGRITNP